MLGGSEDTTRSGGDPLTRNGILSPGPAMAKPAGNLLIELSGTGAAACPGTPYQPQNPEAASPAGHLPG